MVQNGHYLICGIPSYLFDNKCFSILAQIDDFWPCRTRGRLDGIVGNEYLVLRI